MAVRKFDTEDYLLIDKYWQSLKAVAEPRCQDSDEFEVVQKAFDFANQAHKDVRRRSGEPYILHPLEVAKIVVGEIGLGYKSITAALLHDVVEDTEYTVEDIRNLFGDKVAQLVDGLTKIKTVLDNEDAKSSSVIQTESMQAENFKRILLTMGDDVRVVLIKMADRLHNCRTIEYMPEHKRDKILSETMFIFIPLAHRLGLYSIKSEMENIWLKYKEPDDYADISAKIDMNVEKRRKEIDEFVAPIEMALKAKGYSFTIKKRVKTPYSIWFKMRNKNVPFEEIFDLYAVRIIYDPSSNNIEIERQVAYQIYNALKSIYSEQPSRFRNWVNNPKTNGYEALHCTLMSHGGFWVEVQIRSRRMDDIAEKGIAAHWAYKNDGYISEADTEMDRWLANVQKILVSDDMNTLELLDVIHKDLVSTEIVVFTPKGDQRNIPAGSTALDFAYAIHTKVGSKAIAAKVNMKLVQLSHVLKAGDQVEIITAENGKPKMEWLQFLQTRSAKTKVVEYFKDSRDSIITDGERIFNERLEAMGERPSNKIIRKFLDFSQLNDKDEMFFRVGLGLIGPEDFRNIMSDSPKAYKTNSYFISEGDTGQTRYVLADCCNPIPGDPVVGFRLGEKTVVVHKKSCHEAQSLASKFGNRVVIPQWLLERQDYPIRLSIKGLDRVGMLNDITQCISLGMGINMRKIQMGMDGGVFEGYVEMFVHDKKNLDKLIADLKKLNGVQDVVRTDIV